MEFLESLQHSFPEHAAKVASIAEKYNAKLWHELTLELKQLVDEPQLRAQPAALSSLFTQFVQPIQRNLNPLALARLGVHCCPRDDPIAARAFLKQLQETVQGNKEAFHLVRAEEATCCLAAGDPKEAKTILDEGLQYLQQYEAQDLDPSVHAAIHRCHAVYLKHALNWDEFYHTALLYLVYADIATIPREEQQRLAFDIGVAALLGKRIYNFGELLGSPVAAALQGSEQQWVADLLQAFNKGDMKAYEHIVTTWGAQLQQVPRLVEKAGFLKEKMQLMALLNYLFNLDLNKRLVKFADVAAVANVPGDQVEFLLLKALAIGVIKGVIDQVAETISVTWIQARVLDRAEVAGIADKVDRWLANVTATLALMTAENAKLHEANLH
eukprot:TRINITY_DN81050_c0_g1_i1.p1 TRINITY_DN81050_c0_g1~~TRINITY_DN81050_c0_g1_i1.p1  ORF type:complete len:384 (+),score=90.35 TRINITY_DN81050_c0_g1_i1:73-1224(+)